MATITTRRRNTTIIKHRGGTKNSLEVFANGTYTSESGGYSPVIVNIPDGGVTTEELRITENGEYIAPEGVAYRKIIVDVPQGEIVKPSVSIKLSCDSCYDPCDTSLESITVTMTVSKGTNPLKDLKLYVGSTLLQEYESATAGVISFVYTPETPIKTTITLKAVVSDKTGVTGTGTSTVTFVGKTFYGILGPDVTTPTEEQIKSLSTIQKATKGYTWQHIVTDYGKPAYCIPTTMGALASIKDPINNMNYTDSYSVKTVAVNGILYYAYIQTLPSAAEDVTLAFA